jgi:hypothetical protein
MARFGAMTDMARTPEDVKKELGKDMAMMASPAMSSGIKPTVPTYPYGLCVSLDEESMAKLGLDGDLPEVGEMIHFCAMARVTSASMNEREGTDGAKETCRRVELQITHLGLESEDQEQRDWYKDSMGEKPAAKDAA